MLVLLFLSCNLHDNRLWLIYQYPIGVWYANQDLGAPAQAICGLAKGVLQDSLVLPVGPAKSLVGSFHMA